METLTAEISQSEWEVMRVIWTLKGVSSHLLVEILSEKMGWKAATTKTFLGRLVKKGALATEKQGREFFYTATIPEQSAMDQTVQALFDHLCEMKVGTTIDHLLQHVTLSQSDIAQLQAQLAMLAVDAPLTVPCNCLPEDCDAEEMTNHGN
ncbi:CopY/TcrY family copper transport repressor [Lacticaseibacillus brantae]|nr:CopY/TcrY family copper transport repressor [Lacticaseibacillus brantae]